MALHEAIEYVLREERLPMTANEIANAVNLENLYVRNGKREVTASQISARVTKYADVFKIDNQGISLHDISLRPYRDLAVHLKNLIARVLGTFNIIVNDVVASFLVVIFQQGHTTSISPHQIYSPKGFIISLFQNTGRELSFVDGVFTSIIDFISTSLPDRNADEILRLIAYYYFPSLPKPIEDEFATFFNDTVNLFSWKNYFRGGEFSTPKLVSNLM